ncbi:hypothetical protein CF111_21825 [Aeromonas sobria]|nr:hypothetical protein CF111_21825 [Aeromonas sobria]
MGNNAILSHIDDIFGQDMHAKCVLSLANATLGVIEPSWAPRFLPEVVRGRAGGVLPVPLLDGGLEALSVCWLRRFANSVIVFWSCQRACNAGGIMQQANGDQEMLVSFFLSIHSRCEVTVDLASQ